MPAEATSKAMPTPLATEQDLRLMPEDGRKYELVDGVICVSPAGFRHGELCVRIVVRLGSFVEANGLGTVLDSSTGFKMPSGNVRSPDVSFVAEGRIGRDRGLEGYADVVPDLAVEVLSPDDRARYLMDKVGEYLQAGVRLVWVIDPVQRRAAVYRSLTDVQELGAGDFLDGDDVVPGFRCPLTEIFG
jgi:Uma2 family endonuclease